MRIFISLICSYSMSLSYSASNYFSAEEAKHVGRPFPTPAVVSEFLGTKFADDTAVRQNDMMAQHKLIYKFCHKRAKRKNSNSDCTWREYYSLLNHLRAPYSDVYDPGIDKIGRSASTMSYPSTCEAIEKPSASEFLEYIRQNRPFVVRGIGKLWPSYRKWNKRYLLDTLGDIEIAVGVSESGDFVGPEPVKMWGPVPNMNTTLEPFVLARPASTIMLFSDLLTFYQRYADSARSTASVTNPSLYMEYMPLTALKDGVLLKDIPNSYWSHILNPTLLLLWLGGGGTKKNGRLHFDKFENLMTIMAGRKTFILYSPAESYHLYGDLPFRSASLEATVNIDGDDPMWTFNRRPENVFNQSSRIHTYTPVNVQQPDYDLFPLLRYAKGFNCTLEKGDMLYVPSNWWHEVITDDDEEGLSMGINYFFEPYYIRNRLEKEVFLHANRVYSHMEKGVDQTAFPCAKKHVCFKHSKKRSAGGWTRRRRRESKEEL